MVDYSAETRWQKRINDEPGDSDYCDRRKSGRPSSVYTSVSIDAVVGVTPLFLGKKARHETIFEIHAANLIKLGLGKAATFFELVINANYRLVAPSPNKALSHW